MRAVDIEKLVAVGQPTIAPDGSFAVFATSRPDIAANRNVGQLWRVELDGGAANLAALGEQLRTLHRSEGGLRLP